MVKPEKYDLALYAVHDILVRARQMASERAPHEDLAELLDDAEVLPMWLASKDDETESFRKVLEKVATKHRCHGALQRFEGQVPS